MAQITCVACGVSCSKNATWYACPLLPSPRLSPPPRHTNPVLCGRGRDDSDSDAWAVKETDDSDSDAWAVKETTRMRRRREEDQRLVGEIGGDLSVLTIDGHKLKPRKWEPKEPVQVISHIERKRREEEQEVLAAGGTLIADDFFAKPKPSWNEREKAQWQAANLDSGFVSAK